MTPLLVKLSHSAKVLLKQVARIDMRKLSLEPRSGYPNLSEKHKENPEEKRIFYSCACSCR
jgi:hypothetical protein